MHISSQNAVMSAIRQLRSDQARGYTWMRQNCASGLVLLPLSRHRQTHLLSPGGGANSDRLLIECDKNLLILVLLILVKTGSVGSRILFHFGRWKLEIQMDRWAQDLAQKILVAIFVED
jgi:hypothetical protein